MLWFTLRLVAYAVATFAVVFGLGPLLDVSGLPGIVALVLFVAALAGIEIALRHGDR